MATSKKDISPPPRPPAPKPSHLRSKHSPVAVSFKSLDSDNDDDYLSVFAPNSSEKKEKESSFDMFAEPNVCIMMGRKKDSRSPIKNSQSLDETILGKNNRILKNKPEKRNLLTEIKGKLSDKFPDTYNAIAKKLEELTNDSNITNSANCDKGSETLDKEVNMNTDNKLNKSEIKTSEIIREMDDTLQTISGSTDEMLFMRNINFESELTFPSHPDFEDSASKSLPDIKVALSEAFYDPLKNIHEDEQSLGVNVEHLSITQKKPVKPSSLPIIDVFHPVEGLDLTDLACRKRLVPSALPKKSVSNPVSMSSLLSGDGLTEKEETEETDNTHQLERYEKDTLEVKNIETKPSASNATLKSSNATIKTSNVSVKKLFSDSGINFTYVLNALVLLFVFFLVPLPPFINGFIVGGVCTCMVFYFKNFLEKPRKPASPLRMVPLDQLSPLVVPEMKEPIEEDGKYKGWMNEIDKYNENDYHINLTQSVFIRLEGTSLRLSHTDSSVAKRASWAELHIQAKFVDQRCYDLTGCQVYLRPHGLVKKRIWSKKYPICIKLQYSIPILRTVSSENLLDETTEVKNKILLHLFARTGKEKEMWFHRFEAASRGQPLKNHIREIRKCLEFKPRQLNQERLMRKSMDVSISKSLRDDLSLTPVDDVAEDAKSLLMDIDMNVYAQYMARLMPSESTPGSPCTPLSSSKTSQRDNKELKYVENITCEPQLMWLNALIGRCFWELLWTNYWSGKVKQKIQKKISKIRVPYFIEELQVTDIFLGTEMPVIRRAAKPYLDEDGFWVDLDVMYRGGFCMAVETKINLLKLKRVNERDKELASLKTSAKRASTNSDEEDSAESSTDDDDDMYTATPATEDVAMGTSGKSRKIIRYIDRIAKSKYFQQATEYKYVKKAMEGVSNTRMILNVELKSLSGTLAVNIPPPPTDRLWYGFRENPHLSLQARPKVGSHEVNFTHISEWIENKLAIEFQRVFVMPNMDDVIVPLLMPSYKDPSSPSNNQPSPS